MPVMFVLYMEKRTTIQVGHTTLEKLKPLRITKRETYDEILNRLIKYFKEGKNDKR